MNLTVLYLYGMEKKIDTSHKNLWFITMPYMIIVIRLAIYFIKYSLKKKTMEIIDRKGEKNFNSYFLNANIKFSCHCHFSVTFEILRINQIIEYRIFCSNILFQCILNIYGNTNKGQTLIFSAFLHALLFLVCFYFNILQNKAIFQFLGIFITH